jgi:uncharacterized protein YecE (DUF72 family)
MANSFIGASGWSYPQWKQGLYAGCPQKKWFSCYAAHFPAVELNSSFYRLPPQAYIQRWVDQAPPDFRFAVKAWRGITHDARLRDCEDKLAACLMVFRGFGDKLGPVLFQLPPSLKRDDALLAEFLAMLPRDMQYVFEFRHASWQDDLVYALLNEAGMAICRSHVKTWQNPPITTGQLFYARLHGANDWFKGAYSEDFLTDLSHLIKASAARTAYVFFNNTMLGNDAPDNARVFNTLLASQK